jgi:hypothetical protein
MFCWWAEITGRACFNTIPPAETLIKVAGCFRFCGRDP